MNLCGAPSSFSLSLRADDVPPAVAEATRAFDGNYKVELGQPTEKPEGGVWERHLASDTVGPYETAILRLGCDGWSN